MEFALKIGCWIACMLLTVASYRKEESICAVAVDALYYSEKEKRWV